MLAIQKSDSKHCTPHLLPARINHNGPINSTPQYWAPSVDEKGTRHVHFRGRHLHGTHLALPENYTGAVLHTTDRLAPAQPAHTRTADAFSANEDENDTEDEPDARPEEVKIAVQIGDFDALVVWGHGAEVDGESDAFVRGMREWIGFAEAMHCDEDQDQDEDEDEEGVGRARRDTS
ncbi:uncharacterized protein EKO05_0009368 [Ascochyta rabiei]|uniref:Uncharacterized protein n=1 Tax=Didymella rabiei TaxID=5454 RepID=A0A163EV27_DIDRA|nr:uncharacterized protein EKO05_0009368 [Ascochyta rabiei]KZM23942.1 hypothetical protein ST47_g4937 [Ascochyta rabiei]UPX19095.1 hypothetical protein EKO05_0009368 [Ascochyta rabiei]